MATPKRQPVMRVGIVGLGNAANTLLPEVAAHPHVKITAAADVRSDALDTFAREFDAETYLSVEELCQSANVDLVYICTPDHLHAQHAILAAEHGKQVISDKPMARTLEECDAMLGAAERDGVRLLVGHSQSLSTPFLRMAQMTARAELGKVYMVNHWFFSDWLYRPRTREELDPETSGGLLLRQGSIQVDLVRMLCGGMVRSVRASVTALDPQRPVSGGYVAFLEFENGAASSIVNANYDHFNHTELLLGLEDRGSDARSSRGYASGRKLSHGFANPEEEWAHKESTRYGGTRTRRRTFMGPGEKRHPFWGLTIVSCERGDIVQSPRGLTVYGDEAQEEVEIPCVDNYHTYTTVELDAMYQAWTQDKPLVLHDGRWAKATLEVCLGMARSSQERLEVLMAHQTPYKGADIEITGAGIIVP